MPQLSLANAAQLVKPGGLLLTGNMRDTHPQLGFTLNVVQWPHIQPRSIETMQRIVEAAGLGNWRVDVYCPMMASMRCMLCIDRELVILEI